MLDDMIARRGLKPHRGINVIGPRDAERILGVSRTTLHKLTRCGQLPGRFLDNAASGRRRWCYKLSDVIALKKRGAMSRAPTLRRIRVAWVRLFGDIPPGFSVISLDKNPANTAPENLALVPHKTLIRARRYRLRRRRKTAIHRWTSEQRKILRRDFANRGTDELAKEFGCSVLSVRCMARRLRLRKSRAYLRERASSGRRMPIGSERVCVGDKSKGTVWVKVSFKGKPCEQWRPKHHLIWEQTHGRPVPKGMRVIFKDGDKGNFNPANLELSTRGEVFSQAIAKFLTYPAPLRDAIRLTQKLKREVVRRRSGKRDENTPPKRYRAGVKVVRWTQSYGRRVAAGICGASNA